ncbi:hypothetical protein K438DRAFT_1850049 [Mycena galopus ATCC 62051]|nr:hypothetical protein K438DRAFT_1850049 [Mycena galopus ATCC 62051]
MCPSFWHATRGELVNHSKANVESAMCRNLRAVIGSPQDTVLSSGERMRFFQSSKDAAFLAGRVGWRRGRWGRSLGTRSRRCRNLPNIATTTPWNKRIETYLWSKMSAQLPSALVGHRRVVSGSGRGREDVSHGDTGFNHSPTGRVGFSERMSRFLNPSTNVSVFVRYHQMCQFFYSVSDSQDVSLCRRSYILARFAVCFNVRRCSSTGQSIEVGETRMQVPPN